MLITIAFRLICCLILGEAMGFVDLMVWPWMERLPSVKGALDVPEINRERYPRLMAWAHRMLKEPGVKATTYPKELFAKFMTGVIEGKVNYDEGL